MIDVKIKFLFYDIINGYSNVVVRNSHFYLKHLGIRDRSCLDFIYEKELNIAISSGMPTEASRLEWLKKEKIWGEPEEKNIRDQRLFIDGLNKSLDKAVSSHEKTEIQNLLAPARKDLEDNLQKKRNFIGQTAESYADRIVNSRCIQKTLFKDPDCKDFAFSEEDFDSLANDEFDPLFIEYNRTLSEFNEKNIKKIVISPHFIKYIYLCDDDITKFYGKTILNLSDYQIDMFREGMYFKKIFSDIQELIPGNEDILDDPVKIEEFHKLHKNTKELLDKSQHSESAAAAVVGMSAEQQKRLGYIDNNAVDLRKEAAKHGGKLTKEQLIKAHGL